MDLSIRRVAKDSTLSGEPLVPGEVVESFLFRNPEDELERADLRSEELEGWTVPESLLCRWRHRVREVDETRQQAERASVQSAEELFLGLSSGIEAQGDSTPQQAAEQLILFNLLALMLERKRVLRAVPGQSEQFWHVREKRVVTVPRTDLSPERILPLLAELDALL